MRIPYIGEKFHSVSFLLRINYGKLTSIVTSKMENAAGNFTFMIE